MNKLKPIIIKSRQKGPKLLILGSVHGNEHAGTKAIQEVISLFTKNKLTLLRGEIIAVASVNQLVHNENTI